MPKLPSVLIFTPTYRAKDYCMNEFLANCEKLTYPNKTHIIITNDKDPSYAQELRTRLRNKPFKVVWVKRGGSSREAICRAQSYARKVALEGGFDYLLSLESDIFAPPNAIQALMRHGKEVVTGLYFIGSPDKKFQVPCVTVLEFKEDIKMHGTRLLQSDEEVREFCKPGLKQVMAGGMGICLMDRKIVETTPFLFEPDMGGHSDIFWFNDVFRQNIPVFVDTSVYCDHQYSNWNEVKDR